MKYWISVLAGAMSYGVLSTIVVLAYGEGFKLGEVVGAQLLIGLILSWLMALYTKRKALRKKRRQPETSSAVIVDKGLTWKQRLLLMLAGPQQLLRDYCIIIPFSISPLRWQLFYCFNSRGSAH
ncbi:hypothetical protein HMSSN036_13050 [Paenibacillus macerans]|nr:hypothetical protein HMSSN036_13050 [Paenibacillus macerans]